MAIEIIPEPVIHISNHIATGFSPRTSSNTLVTIAITTEAIRATATIGKNLKDFTNTLYKVQDNVINHD